ncbi:MAG: heavy-metal-associated domain-containing protein [Chloroflexota bacterium]
MTEELMQKVKIDGMNCPHCAAKVKKALENTPGVRFAEVDHKEGEAVVSGDAKEELLKNAVETAGYKFVEIVKD